MAKVTQHYEYTIDGNRSTRAEVQLHKGKWIATAYVDQQSVGPQDDRDAARNGLVKALRALADDVERDEDDAVEAAPAAESTASPR